MTRLASAFAKGRPALVCFITAGDGDTAANLDALVAGGADVIELGMPFTDPMADGPAIQAGNLRSLGAGTKTLDVLMIATELPVAVGFGVRTPEQAAEIARVADGVVVGSALVELVGQHGDDAPRHLRELTEALSGAVRSARAVNA